MTLSKSEGSSFQIIKFWLPSKDLTWQVEGLDISLSLTVSSYRQFTLETTMIILFNTWVQCSVWQKYTKVLMSPRQLAFWLQMVVMFYLFLWDGWFENLKKPPQIWTAFDFFRVSDWDQVANFLILLFALISHPFNISLVYVYTYGSCQLPLMVCLSLWSLSLLVASPPSFLPSGPLFLLCSCSVLLMLHVFPANMRHGYQYSLMTLICYFLAKIFTIWQCDRMIILCHSVQSNHPGSHFNFH